MVRFNETNVRAMGRAASGVRGINIPEDSIVVGMDVVETGKEVFVITKNGYGKKTPVEEYRITNRGGKGVKTLNITEKNGVITSFKTVDNTKDLIIVTDEGIIIRLDVDKISVMSRVTQGVKLINLRDGQKVSSISIVDKDNSQEENLNNNESI
mgnify:CR=1 FL=1